MRHFATSERTSSAFKTGVAALAVVGSSLFAGQALANTGAGAKILNVATVTWEDAGANSYSETDDIDVTVSLVAAAPTLTAPTDQSVSSGATATYSYRITTNANGEDTYTLSAASDATSNLSSNAQATSAASVILNASVIIADDDVDGITIPAGSEGTLTSGDTVTISGTDYVVNTVTAGTQASHTNAAGNDGTAGTTNAETPTTVTLFLSDGTTAADFSGVNLAAALMAEYQTFNTTVDGTVTAGQASGTNTVTTTATDGTNPATDQTITTFTLANLTITKEASTDGTTWVSASGSLSAAPTDTVYYRITVNNPSATDASNVVISDAIADYTTYTASSGEISLGTAGGINVGGGTGQTDADDSGVTDEYNYNITTANTVTWGPFTLQANGGNDTAVMIYAVTID